MHISSQEEDDDEKNLIAGKIASRNGEQNNNVKNQIIMPHLKTSTNNHKETLTKAFAKI